MKKMIVLAVMVLLAGYVNAGVVFSEVMPDSSHGKDVTNDNGDWFEITNTGAEAVSLSGWSWVDDGDHDKLMFPDISIAAGESIICLQEEDASDWLSSWGLSSSGLVVVTELDLTDSNDENDFHGLSKNSDGLFLYDNTDTLVDSFTWSETSGGVSIDIINGAMDSEVGVNGAWASNDADGESDIASPGVVPEPATMLLLAAGSLALSRRK